MFLGYWEWLREEWNRPSRADHYAMQVASCALAPHLKSKVDDAAYKIKFRWDRPTAEAADDAARTAERARLDRTASLIRLGAAGALRKGMTTTYLDPAPVPPDVILSTDEL